MYDAEQKSSESRQRKSIKKSNHRNLEIGDVTEFIFLVIVLAIVSIAGLTLPKMPFEPPSIYCNRVNPFDVTKQHDCIDEYTLPDKSLMAWLEKTTNGVGTKEEYICMGKILEHNYDRDELKNMITDSGWRDKNYARRAKVEQSLKNCIGE